MARILVLDDEPMYCRRLSQALTREGHDARAATTSTEAANLAREEDPELLITDWMLRERSTGVDVANALRQDNPTLPIIVITGYPSPKLESELGEMGRVSLLPKPFEYQELLEAVTAALEPEE